MEYQHKLETLLSETKKEAIQLEPLSDNALELEISAQFEAFKKSNKKGNIIDAKRHGVKLIALISNQVIKSC